MDRRSYLTGPVPWSSLDRHQHPSALHIFCLQKKIQKNSISPPSPENKQPEIFVRPCLTKSQNDETEGLIATLLGIRSPDRRPCHDGERNTHEKEHNSMPEERNESGSLATQRATREQTVVLVQSLLVTWSVLDHLKLKGVIKSREGVSKLRADDGCCAPDGGTCCVNRKIE
jgi:hypothetical protein